MAVLGCRERILRVIWIKVRQTLACCPRGQGGAGGGPGTVRLYITRWNRFGGQLMMSRVFGKVVGRGGFVVGEWGRRKE